MPNNDRPIKWILIGDEIRLSHALYHRDLLRGRETRCEGGGVVTIDKTAKTITFSGESDDFGKADQKAFMNALDKSLDRVRLDLYFCTREDVDGYSVRFI